MGAVFLPHVEERWSWVVGRGSCFLRRENGQRNEGHLRGAVALNEPRNLGGRYRGRILLGIGPAG